MLRELQYFQKNQVLSHTLYAQHIEPVCRKHHLTRMELDILLFLANNPGFDTASDIVEIRRLTKSHVSTSVKSLENRGFLTKSYTPSNRKTAHLSLCDPAMPAVTDGQTAQKKFFDAVFRGFLPEDFKTMERLLNLISSNIQSASSPGLS